VPDIKKETGSGSHIRVKGGNCPLNFFDCFELFLNNRHWFDCFELIKSYIISNWIGYDKELNTFTRWTSKHFNCCQWVKIDICKIKGWFFLKKKKEKKKTNFLFLEMIYHDKFKLSILIHIYALCTACYMVMGCEMGFDELMFILLWIFYGRFTIIM
jgi:hypothetical protein